MSVSLYFLGGRNTKTLLNDVEVKTGIKWIESSESFVMSGTLKQVEEAHSFLQENACQSNGIVHGFQLPEKKQLAIRRTL